MLIKGSLVALVTPFDRNGAVNYQKLAELIEWHIQQKTDGLVVLGTTGEASTLTYEEEQEVLRFTVDLVAKRIPVIAGSGSNDTQTAIAKSLRFEELGADALLVITPYYNKTNDVGMQLHFFAIADQVNIPIILYNVPGRTGCRIEIPVLEKLREHRNIIGIKEASGDISYVMEVSRLLRDDFILLSGNDDSIVPLLSVGATGVISVWANIMPKSVHELVNDYLTGNAENSLKMQRAYLEVVNELFVETNPIPIKFAMNYLGFDVGGLRLPLAELSPKAQINLIKLIQPFEEELKWK